MACLSLWCGRSLFGDSSRGMTEVQSLMQAFQKKSDNKPKDQRFRFKLYLGMTIFLKAVSVKLNDAAS